MEFLLNHLKPKRMMLLKSCVQYVSKLEKLSSGHRTWKYVFIPFPKKGSTKECSNYGTIALILHASKVIHKILQPRLQQKMNWEHSDVQAGFRKGRGTRDQIANIQRIIERKQRDSRKTSASASLTILKTLCGSQQTLKNSWRYGNTRPPYLSPKKPVCRSRSNS